MIHTADVAVVGGGLGGVAAALAAAETGATVVLTAEEPVVGGQVTAQATSPLDEHPLIETTGAPGAYLEFRRRVRARYDGRANPGGGWVSRLCFPPQVGREVLEGMLAPHVDAGRIRIHLGARPVAVRTRTGDDGAEQVVAVCLDVAGEDLEVRADVVVDATELGDVLALAGADVVVGSEGQDAFGEPHALPGAGDPRAEQSVTWVAGLRLTDTPAEPVAAPASYAELEARGAFGLDIPGWDGTTHRYRMFEDGPTGNPPFWTYRRVHDASVLGGDDAIVLNWASNDYAGAGVVADPETAAREARELTLAFVHWLQTAAPRDGGGHGYPELVLAPDVTGTDDGLATAPYVRESRRLASSRPVTENDIAPRDGAARSTRYEDSVGTAWYHADLHPRVGHPEPVYAPTAPFQVPARALVPEPGRGPVNLLAGAKNLAATQVAAAAYRVHPGEWSVGEAAGVIAAHAVRTGTSPGALLGRSAGIRTVQSTLLDRGTALAWAEDLPVDHPAFRAGQRAILGGALRGDRASTLAVRPDEPVDDEERAAIALAFGLDDLPLGRTWAESVLAADAAVPTMLQETR
ncbi:FAD dependent oxidoreductase [Paraoerskovia marina]|uniref:FAD dependent oxidoreductase n=1 Tax=Paraoerskovia marina TaxID=545619 RepID=A0A1H1M4N6_9CELL|nr:FAD-dependent oxidoreductase [Paraoerskovia marina]SDR81647.1 FAD dependent oxidoreductase [Paraoerskovia marina]